MENVKTLRIGRERTVWRGDGARECMELTHAACILMAADPELSPDDAVDDVYQVYRHICELRRR